MYEQMVENFRKVSEASVQMQQDLLKQWTSGSFSGFPMGSSTWLDQTMKVRKEWAEVLTDIARKQKSVFESRMDAGIKVMEDSLKLAQCKDLKEFKAASEDLWKKSVESAKELTETQVRQFQSAVEKCMSVAAKTTT